MAYMISEDDADKLGMLVIQSLQDGNIPDNEFHSECVDAEMRQLEHVKNLLADGARAYTLAMGHLAAAAKIFALIGKVSGQEDKLEVQTVSLVRSIITGVERKTTVEQEKLFKEWQKSIEDRITGG